MKFILSLSDLTGCLFIVYILGMLLLAWTKYEQWKHRPKVSKYKRKSNDTQKIFKAWDYFYIVPAVIFVLLRVVWWPRYQGTLDAEVAAMMNYDTVWYNPERPRVWISCVTLFVIGLYLLNILLKEWKKTFKKKNYNRITDEKIDKENEEFIRKLFLTLFPIVSCLGSVIYGCCASDDISAIYFGDDKVSVVGNWIRDKIIVSDLAHVTCHSETKIEKNKVETVIRKYYILQYSGGNSCKIVFEDDEWQYKWHPAIVKSDRKAVIDKLEKLEEACKVYDVRPKNKTTRKEDKEIIVKPNKIERRALDKAELEELLKDNETGRKKFIINGKVVNSKEELDSILKRDLDSITKTRMN